MTNIDLLNCFLSGLVDGLAIFPVYGHAEQGLDPVEHDIFEVFQKIEILRFSEMRFLISKCSLSNSKLVFVLVETEHEKSEKTSNNPIESPEVRKHSIQFAIASSDYSVDWAGEYVKLEKNGQVQVIDNCCHNAFVHKIACH